MESILLISKNIFKLIFRKKSNIMIYIFLPVIVTVVLVMIFSSAGSELINIGILDNDSSEISSSYQEFLVQSGKYSISEIGADNINEKISTGVIAFGVIIPEGFQDSILKGNNAKVDIYSIKGVEVTAWVDNFTNIFMQNMAEISLAANGDTDKFTKMLNNIKNGEVRLLSEELEDEFTGKLALKQVIGLLLFFLMLAASITASFIIKEKKSKTYHRIYISPVSNKSYLAGNIFTNLFITTVQIILIIILLVEIIGVRIQMSPIALFIILECFALVIISIGLVIAAFSKDEKMVNAISPLILTPSCMLSGCFWDIRFMPEFMKKVAMLMPQRWVMIAIEKMQSNTELIRIIPELSIIIAFAVTFFLIAVYKIRFSQKISV